MDSNKKDNSVPNDTDQTKSSQDNDRRVNLMVDDVSYHIEFEPFFFNEQVRYNVQVNTGPTNVFVWDETVQQFRAINDGASVIPVPLEQAISTHLLTQNL